MLTHETVSLKIVNGIYIKRTVFPRAGMVVQQHAHSYAHLTVCAVGCAVLSLNEREVGLLRAGDVMEVPAFARHHFNIVLPGTILLCIHKIEDAEAAEDAVEMALAGNDHAI